MDFRKVLHRLNEINEEDDDPILDLLRARGLAPSEDPSAAQSAAPMRSVRPEPRPDRSSVTSPLTAFLSNPQNRGLYARRSRNAPAVREVQTILGHFGLDTGGVDGRYGPKTIEAVRSFQRAARLTVDGDVGRQTGPALIRYNDFMYELTDLLEKFQVNETVVKRNGLFMIVEAVPEDNPDFQRLSEIYGELRNLFDRLGSVPERYSRVWEKATTIVNNPERATVQGTTPPAAAPAAEPAAEPAADREAERAADAAAERPAAGSDAPSREESQRLYDRATEIATEIQRLITKMNLPENFTIRSSIASSLLFERLTDAEVQQLRELVAELKRIEAQLTAARDANTAVPNAITFLGTIPRVLARVPEEYGGTSQTRAPEQAPAAPAAPAQTSPSQSAPSQSAPGARPDLDGTTVPPATAPNARPDLDPSTVPPPAGGGETGPMGIPADFHNAILALPRTIDPPTAWRVTGPLVRNMPQNITTEQLNFIIDTMERTTGKTLQQWMEAIRADGGSQRILGAGTQYGEFMSFIRLLRDLYQRAGRQLPRGSLR